MQRSLVVRSLLIHGHDDGSAPRRLRPVERFAVSLDLRRGIQLIPKRAAGCLLDLVDRHAGDVADDHRCFGCRRAPLVGALLTGGVKGNVTRRGRHENREAKFGAKNLRRRLDRADIDHRPR